MTTLASASTADASLGAECVLLRGGRRGRRYILPEEKLQRRCGKCRDTLQQRNVRGGSLKERGTLLCETRLTVVSEGVTK